MSFIQQIGLEAGNKNALGKLHPGPDRQVTGALFTVSSLVSVAGPAAVSNSGAASPSLQATCCSRWAPIWKGAPGHSRVLCAEGVRAPPDRSTLTQGQGWQRAGPGPGALPTEKRPASSPRHPGASGESSSSPPSAVCPTTCHWADALEVTNSPLTGRGPPPPPQRDREQTHSSPSGTPRANCDRPSRSEGLCALCSQSAANETVRNSERNLLSKGSYAHVPGPPQAETASPGTSASPKGRLLGKRRATSRGHSLTFR